MFFCCKFGGILLVHFPVPYISYTSIQESSRYMMTSVVKSLTTFLFSFVFPQRQPVRAFWHASGFFLCQHMEKIELLSKLTSLTRRAHILPIWICSDSSQTHSTFSSQGQCMDTRDVRIFPPNLPVPRITKCQNSVKGLHKLHL